MRRDGVSAAQARGRGADRGPHGKDAERVKATRDGAGPHAGTAVSCDVAAYAVVQAIAADVAVLRPTTGPVGGKPLAAAFVRHLDEQTVVGLHAVYRAVHAHGLDA